MAFHAPSGYSCGRSISRNQAGGVRAQGPAATRILPEGRDPYNDARVDQYPSSSGDPEAGCADAGVEAAGADAGVDAAG